MYLVLFYPCSIVLYQSLYKSSTLTFEELQVSPWSCCFFILLCWTMAIRMITIDQVLFQILIVNIDSDRRPKRMKTVTVISIRITNQRQRRTEKHLVRFFNFPILHYQRLNSHSVLLFIDRNQLSWASILGRVLIGQFFKHVWVGKLIIMHIWYWSIADSQSIRRNLAMIWKGNEFTRRASRNPGPWLSTYASIFCSRRGRYSLVPSLTSDFPSRSLQVRWNCDSSSF